MSAEPPRIRLVHGPTPLTRFGRLADRLGVDLWVKRDDCSGGVEAGNKVRKLEYLIADALEHDADTVLTCGGAQSNHCRATAAICARFGLACVAFLRVDEPRAPLPTTGNTFLMRTLGADLHAIGPADYADRARLLEAAAATLRKSGKRPYVIPEGGSNGRGSLGYVAAMGEVRAQLDAGLAGRAPFDLIAHACGSGGTAAGVSVGAGRFEVASEVLSFAVCDDRAYFEQVIASIARELRALDPALASVPAARVVVDDSAKGPRYGVASPEQRRFLVDVARTSGLVLDPVYTGKAFYGLARTLAARPDLLGKRVLFLHTGGLPGLLAQADDLANEV